MLDLTATSLFVGPKTWRGVSKLTCRPTRADVCGPKGCEKQEPVAWIEVVNPSSPTLRRCTATGCDDTKAQVNYSGAFANINIPGNASFVRLTANDAYVETVSLMDTILIYRGRCERGR